MEIKQGAIKLSDFYFIFKAFLEKFQACVTGNCTCAVVEFQSCEISPLWYIITTYWNFVLCTIFTVAPVLSGIFDHFKYHNFWQRKFWQQRTAPQQHSSDISLCCCHLYFIGPLVPLSSSRQVQSIRSPQRVEYWFLAFAPHFEVVNHCRPCNFATWSFSAWRLQDEIS